MLTNVIEYLTYSASVYPNKTAFRDKKKIMTFVELEKQSRQLGYILYSALKGRVRQPIGIYLPKGVDCITAFFAAVYSGNFYAPLDSSMPKSRLLKILNILHPAVVITDTAHFDIISELCSDSLVINLEAAVTVSMDHKWLGQVQKNHIDTDPLYVMFTSGSTGVPKGVVITHRAVIDYTEWLAETFYFSSETVFGNQAPFYFDNSVLDIYSTVKGSCETVIIPEELFLFPNKLCVFLNDRGINTIFWVPSALSLVANSGILKKAKELVNLKKILFCGEVMPTKILNLWRQVLPNAMYVNLYGPTEITDVCTCYIVDREFNDSENLPIGAPCRNTDVLVLNEEKQPVTGEELGELYIRGTCLAHGYYGDMNKTKEVFCQNPLNDKYPETIYKTGDLVRYNKNGELVFVGRKDYQIKHMGHRVELGEIEAAASLFEQIEQCCALYNNEKQVICLFVSPKETDKRNLYAYLKDSLPCYMLPQVIITEKQLPLNPNGKIDRVKLKEKLEEGMKE